MHFIPWWRPVQGTETQDWREVCTCNGEARWLLAIMALTCNSELCFIKTEFIHTSLVASIIQEGLRSIECCLSSEICFME